MSADEWSGITDADRLREALRVCPEGYAVVPRSPTNEMLAAGQPYVTGYEDMRSAYDCWHNMVAAAPAAFECGECERDLRAAVTGEEIDRLAQRLHDDWQRERFPKFVWRRLDEIDEATGVFDKWRATARAYLAGRLEARD